VKVGDMVYNDWAVAHGLVLTDPRISADCREDDDDIYHVVDVLMPWGRVVCAVTDLEVLSESR
jgi:hypothetical protein